MSRPTRQGRLNASGKLLVARRSPDADDGHLIVVTRGEIERNYLPTAIARIVSLIRSQNQKVALQASIWIAEMCLGKPRQILDATDNAATVAAAELARSYRAFLEEAKRLAAPAVEGQVRVLAPEEKRE